MLYKIHWVRLPSRISVQSGENGLGYLDMKSNYCIMLPHCSHVNHTKLNTKNIAARFLSEAISL